jgi:hypothetical protein
VLVRVAIALVVIVGVVLIVRALLGVAGFALRRGRESGWRPSRSAKLAPPKQVKYDWERRRGQLSRQLKGVPGLAEDRDGMLAFLDSHAGVDAYVEPRTVMSPMTVVLIDLEGEWKRFELQDDAILRELASTRGVHVLDATRVGYPERMRRRRGGKPGD